MSSLAGSFLVAKPALTDPNFRGTVVLLMQHDEEGACGVVVNRPTEVEGVAFPVFVGGPCEAPGLFMLHGHPKWTEGSPASVGPKEGLDREVAPGIFVGDAFCFQQATKTLPNQKLHFRVVRGYSGWGPGQLERELAVGVWVITPANAVLLFETPFAELWDRLAPSNIPQPSVN